MSETLPNGWTYAQIVDLCTLINGKAFKPTDWSENGIPIIRIQNLNNPSAPFNYFNDELPEKFKVKNDELLFAWSGTPGTSFGAHIWRGGDAVLNQHIFKINFNEKNIDKEFFRYALNQKLDELISNAQGGVGLRHITKRKFEQTQITFPPYPDQKRIVAELDILLAKVDACKARLDKVPDIIKRFRQSVLADATSGKLTEDWRVVCQYQKKKVEEPFSHWVEAPKDWKLYDLGTVCEFVGGSQPSKSKFLYEQKSDTIRLIQIRDYKTDNKKVFIPIKLARRFCSKDDVMIGRYGPPIFQILRGLDGAYNVALMKAEPNPKTLDKKYLYFYLQNHNLFRYVEAASDRTAGQSGVNKRLLTNYPIFLPALDEQKKIVHRVKTLFSVADQMEEKLKDGKVRVDKLTASVLAKAFRGELVSQDPNDPPASELLERIRAERAASATTQKTSKRTEKKSKDNLQSLKLDKTEIAVKSVPAEPLKKSTPEEPIRKPTPTEQLHKPTEPLFEKSEILQAFRKAVFRQSEIDELSLLRLVGNRLGIKRLSQPIREELESYINTAIRRKILFRYGDGFIAGTPSIQYYDDDYLIKVIGSVTKKGWEYPRDFLVDEAAQYLGFGKPSDAFKDRMKSIFRVAIRRGLVYRNGSYVGKV